VNRSGKTISLVQQGNQTPRNKKTKMTRKVSQLTILPRAIMTWNSDAQVLMSTCPKWGNLVTGLK
jgi:hypothetical protein